MNNIRELMERACMQQKQLAAMCKVSGPTISDWVNNKKNPSGKNLKQLEEVFGVSSGVILGYDPVPREGKTPGRDPVIKKEAPYMAGLRDGLIELLVDLSPEEEAQVRAFVAGMKANRKP